MEFLPTVSMEPTPGELRLWDALKEALRPEDGFAFLRYPIFPKEGGRRFEPDILILHRQLGLIVIEVKDCHVQHVEALEGAQWRMRHWHSALMRPYEQAQRQMWAMLEHFKRYEALRHLHATALVALPFVTEEEWAERGFSTLPCNPGILHQNQLTPARLRKRLHELSQGPIAPELSDAEWQLACQVLGLRPVFEAGRAPTPILEDGHLATNLLDQVRYSESIIPALDLEQLKIGLEIPPGPQRIRGIAGSGKTLLLALKAARMHLSHPEWDIAFTFNTKSLYQVVIANLTRFCRHFGDRDPDWSKLQVLHAWGNAGQQGLYRLLAQQAKHPARSLDWVKAQHGSRSPAENFGLVCRDLLAHGTVPAAFDAILIDEGQDFLPEFFQLAYAALKPPKRLVWAYDEAQSLDHLKVPNAETLFGRDAEGKLNVDLTGMYPLGIHKSRIMRRCYRTPARILLPAHAFGMGLARDGGAVQLLTTRQGWQDIGYMVEGSFDSAGKSVTLHRPLEHCPHPMDQLPDRPGVLFPRPFEDRLAELEDTAARLDDLVQHGFTLDDALVVFLGESLQNRAIEADMAQLAELLKERALEAHLATNANASKFRAPGAVTLSGIHRAKGHEAPFVFVVGLDRLAKSEQEVAVRNQLFVGLTRARGVCRLSGVTPGAERLFAELGRIMAGGDRLTFTPGDPGAVSRVMEQETERPEVLPFVRHLPLYDVTAAAGPWRAARVPDPEVVEWVDASEMGRLSDQMFAIRIVGQSMEPRIRDGALAVFQRYEGEPPVDKIVLASLTDEGAENGFSLVVKRLEVAEAGFALTSFNAEFKPIRVVPSEDSPVRIEAIFRGLLKGKLGALS